MSITIFSVMTSIIWCTLLLFIAFLFSRSSSFIAKYGVSGILVLMISGVVRLLLPVEFNSSKVLGDSTILPSIQRCIRINVFSFRGISISVSDILLGTWIIGCIIYLVRFFLSIRRFQKNINTLKTCELKQYERIMKAVSSDSKKRYQLIISNAISCPMMTGLLVPIILVPPLELDDKEIEYILKHEWFHYTNRDIWKKLLFNIICSFFWWNPFMYLIRERLNYLLEINCDQNVINGKERPERIKYVETVVKVINNATNSKPELSSAVIPFSGVSKSSSIIQRCKLVLEAPKTPNILGSISLLISVLLLLSSYAFVIQPVTKDPPSKKNDGAIYVSISPENSYLLNNFDGTYSMYYEDQLVTKIQEIDLQSLPYSILPIKN